MLRYNVAAWAVTGLPVHSVLVVLRPKANATDQTGQLDIPGADGRPYLSFRYTVVRVWLETVDTLLGAGLGVTPLSMLTNEAAADLSAAFGRLQERLRADGVPDNVIRSLLGSTFVLCGLRYSRGQVEDLYRNLSMTLEDSTTYQLILERGLSQGETREARAMILRLGAIRFGPPTPEVEAALPVTGSVVTYSPTTGYTGSDSFTYTISDGHGGTDTATVTLTVTASPPPPLSPPASPPAPPSPPSPPPSASGGISGRVWTDSDADGIQDLTESGVQAVPVYLLDANNNVVATASTGLDGAYSFTSVANGTYHIQVVLPLGYTFSSEDQGADDNIDSDVNSSGYSQNVTISGSSSFDIDAGIHV